MLPRGTRPPILSDGGVGIVLELNTKKLGNSPSFLTNTHTTMFAKQFRNYDFLPINVTAEFRFWTTHQLIGI
jgi:hypothetical protein